MQKNPSTPYLILAYIIGVLNNEDKDWLLRKNHTTIVFLEVSRNSSKSEIKIAYQNLQDNIIQM